MARALLLLSALLVFSCRPVRYSYYFDHVKTAPPNSQIQPSSSPSTGDQELISEVSDRHVETQQAHSATTTTLPQTRREKQTELRSLKQSLIASARPGVSLRPMDGMQMNVGAGINIADQSTKEPFKITGRAIGGFLLVVLGVTMVVTGGIAVILLGTAIWLLGIFLIYPDAANKKSNKKKDKETGGTGTTGQYMDVVHLKNGSVVRGTIIEQSAERVTIKTVDGNTFEYKMEEIQKLTKEKN